MVTSISLLSSPAGRYIHPLHTRCVRVCGKNAGYEVTCFSPTHMNYFTSRSFVCVSHRNHITQDRGTRHSFFFLVLPDMHVMWHTDPWKVVPSPINVFYASCIKLNHKLCSISRDGTAESYSDGLRAGRLGFDSRQGKDIILFSSVQTGSSAHPASYTMVAADKVAEVRCWPLISI
jgi:hypothetical protein